MMDVLEMDVLEREERILQRQLDDGEIDQAEYNRELRDCEKEYVWHAREAAQEAFDREMENWE